ncbi:MAG: hypothetical protein LBH55_00470, partial [Mycoplasmataceae bacterium]|nr:hypothetical protein [Mycoplasmataceae bacterium]
EEITKSKTKFYREVKEYFINELKFMHDKDSDYITPVISNLETHDYIKQIASKFPFFPKIAVKFKITNIDEKIYNGLISMNKFFNKNKKGRELENEKEMKQEEEFKL